MPTQVNCLLSDQAATRAEIERAISIVTAAVPKAPQATASTTAIAGQSGGQTNRVRNKIAQTNDTPQQISARVSTPRRFGLIAVNVERVIAF